MIKQLFELSFQLRYNKVLNSELNSMIFLINLPLLSIGAGDEQERVRCLTPLPHFVLHSDQSPHDPQLPGTYTVISASCDLRVKNPFDATQV